MEVSVVSPTAGDRRKHNVHQRIVPVPQHRMREEATDSLRLCTGCDKAVNCTTSNRVGII